VRERDAEPVHRAERGRAGQAEATLVGGIGGTSLVVRGVVLVPRQGRRERS
jgi:hypothetical protein